jgi:hypothetical protein
MECIMIDKEVNAEELAESRRNRQAVGNAKGDGTPVSDDNDKRLPAIQKGDSVRTWFGHIRQWFAAQSSSMRP